MNWLDVALIVILIVGAYLGMKTGLISTAFAAIGVLVGIALAGTLSNKVGAWFAGSIANDTLVTVISYAIIIVAALLVASIVGKIVRKILSMLFLGFVDRLGGLAVGVALQARRRLRAGTR